MTRIVFRERKPRKTVDLNVTSLVDVLFLLLIFFTLTSTFKRAGELDLKLPESTTATRGRAGSGASAKPIELVLTEQGTLMLDGAPTTFDQLLPKLDSAHQRQPDGQVTIEAEERVSHGQVVKLLDAVRAAGFRGVSLGVRNVERASGGPVR
jgi:biopolymer transport protein ExbD